MEFCYILTGEEIVPYSTLTAAFPCLRKSRFNNMMDLRSLL